MTCRAVVNAAGINADSVNNMVCTQRLKISCRRGEYQLYHNKLHPFERTMFQVPSSKGKGVLITHAAFGNLIVGPNSVEQEDKTSVATTAEGLAEIVGKARKTWPELGNDDVISNFAGLRATNADGGDFVIGESSSIAGFFNAACIDSPGLASAPAIAQDIANQVAQRLDAAENSDFDPMRVSNPPFAFSSKETQEQLLAQDADYGVTVCRCCKVTKAEIANVLGGPLGVHSLDAVKWRTGAMMGPCQGGRCMAKIAMLVQEQLGTSLGAQRKRNQDSYIAASSPDAGSTCKASFAANAQAVSFDEGVVERPRAAYRIPGSRPAGVYSARGAIELMAKGAVPGSIAVVWGSTSLAKTATELMRQAGMSVTAVSANARITKISGANRVQMVSIQEGDAHEELLCDTLVISHDLGKAEA